MASYNYTKMICDLCQKKVDIHIYTAFSQVHWEEVDGDSHHEITPWKHIDLSVLFKTEQNEGTPCEPYFNINTLDICPECYDRLLNQWPIVAFGAQGYNTYESKGAEEKKDGEKRNSKSI